MTIDIKAMLDRVVAEVFDDQNFTVDDTTSSGDSWLHGVHVSSRFDKDRTAIIRASYEWMDALVPKLNVQTILFDYDDVEPEKEAELRRLILKEASPTYAGCFQMLAQLIQPNHVLPPACGDTFQLSSCRFHRRDAFPPARRVSFRTRVRCSAHLPNSEIALYGCLMARMTPQEATAVNILLGYFAGRPELPPREIVRSLEILANRAHNRLQGGWDEVAVRRQWPYAYEDGGQERDSTGQDTEDQV